jgi:hypothetical protein
MLLGLLHPFEELNPRRVGQCFQYLSAIHLQSISSLTDI